MGVIVPKLRQSARGQECTLQTSYCNCDRSTTVLCHLPSEVKGMATKSDDWHAVFGCSSCHEYLDSRKMLPEAELFYSLRALRRTQRIWRDMGLMAFPETAQHSKPSTKIVQRSPLYARGS